MCPLNASKVSALVNSSAVHEQLGGLLLVQVLIPLECEDNASKSTIGLNVPPCPGWGHACATAREPACGLRRPVGCGLRAVGCGLWAVGCGLLAWS